MKDLDEQLEVSKERVEALERALWRLPGQISKASPLSDEDLEALSKDITRLLEDPENFEWTF